MYFFRSRPRTLLQQRQQFIPPSLCDRSKPKLLQTARFGPSKPPVHSLPPVLQFFIIFKGVLIGKAPKLLQRAAKSLTVFLLC